MQLRTAVKHLDRVGPTLEKRLAVLGITQVEHLLHHYPLRYEDFRTMLPVAQVPDGVPVSIKGKIELIATKRSPRKRTMITEAIVADDSDKIKVVWFGQPFLTKTLFVGDTVYLSGTMTNDRFGRQMVSPAYEKEQRGDQAHTARIVPIYPLTKGITQKQLRGLVKQVLPALQHIEEWVPEHIRDAADLMPLGEALKAIHFPESQEERAHAERRLKFDEIFVLQLRAEMLRQAMQSATAPEIPFAEEAIRTFVHQLPFALTKDQKVAAWEILQDMERSIPMNRLLEGDVGSGKTVVAAIVAQNAALSGQQVVVMAPTEILAKQHYESLVQYLGASHGLALLTSSECRASNHTFEAHSKKGKRDELLQQLRSGDTQILVGTHAVIVDDVAFHCLGLVIVDEQHRFGVEQRRRIREKSGDKTTTPHFLSMTATPIPRSFALTLYGDLDVSIIKELPPGRKPIHTRRVDPHNRDKAYAFIREQVRAGRQAFVICPLIEESGSGVEKKSVLAEYTRLSEEVFPELRLAYVHGRMRSQEKDETMQQFASGQIDMLISTSVVEVGVNIPNASIMVIEDADRFGLAQLHQFRGRVGRAAHQSYCFLFTESDSEQVQKRLAYFEQTRDGFALAEYDLEQRGPGEVYGKAQSGMQQFRLATMRDVEIIKTARDLARDCDFEAFPQLKEKVAAWEAGVHLE